MSEDSIHANFHHLQECFGNLHHSQILKRSMRSGRFFSEFSVIIDCHQASIPKRNNSRWVFGTSTSPSRYSIHLPLKDRVIWISVQQSLHTASIQAKVLIESDHRARHGTPPLPTIISKHERSFLEIQWCNHGILTAAFHQSLPRICIGRWPSQSNHVLGNLPMVLLGNQPEISSLPWRNPFYLHSIQ